MSEEMKITATLKDAVVLENTIRGKIYGDVKGRFKDGDVVQTSRLLKHILPDIWVTKNSTYKVELSKPLRISLKEQLEE